MARYLLLAACCVMVMACFLDTTDAKPRSCQNRCIKSCRQKYPGRSARDDREDCQEECYDKFRYCQNCRSTIVCKRCVKGFRFDDDRKRCVATSGPVTPAATTPAQPPAETTAGAPGVEQTTAGAPGVEQTTAGAPEVEPCDKKGVACPNGLVIDRTKVCDGTPNDCPNNSDETTLCGDSATKYSCEGVDRPNTEICDCTDGCSAGTDETDFRCSTCEVGQYDCGADGCLQESCP